MALKGFTGVYNGVEHNKALISIIMGYLDDSMAVTLYGGLP